MKLKIWITVFCSMGLLACGEGTTTTEHPEWERFFAAREWVGAFVVENVATGAVDYYNSWRSDEGFLPASTFKIVNTLIALQTDVLHPDTLFVWDSVPRRLAVWNRDMTLSEAFQASCVPIFQGIARQVGAGQMQCWCDSLSYGRMVVADSLDNFWLEGQSRITPREQASFVARLARRELPLRAEVMEQVAGIMLLEENPAYRIYGKTGTTWEGPCWLVGWVETDGGCWSYALNFDAPHSESQPDGNQRRELVREILHEMGII